MHTRINDDSPRFYASIQGSLGLPLQLLPHLQACVCVVGQLLHGGRIAAHVHQHIRHIQLCHLQINWATLELVHAQSHAMKMCVFVVLSCYRVSSSPHTTSLQYACSCVAYDAAKLSCAQCSGVQQYSYRLT